MSMNIKYKGGFKSISGVLYEINILVDGYVGSETNIAFTNEPLNIEWPDADKFEAVRSSNATVNLYSDSDRQFIDLYTVKPGSIRMDVYRTGILYWSGTLDPELYEEPYAYKTDYGVKLTFADFAILDRNKWTATGFITLRAAITMILASSGINYTEIEEHISTQHSTYNTEDLLDTLSINTNNFFDEDGEALSLRDSLEGILKPFGLTLVQKSGKVIIYDLNCIITAFKPETIIWNLDDSSLSVDKIYNNVKVNFSPYEKTELIKGKIPSDSIGTEKQLTTLVYTESNSSEIGFYTYLSDTGSGVTKNEKAKYFKIEPVFSGQECDGIAWTVKTHTDMTDYISYANDATSNIGSLLMKIPESPYLNYLGLGKDNYRLKLTMQILFDVRYNPFEEAQVQNEEGDYDRLKNWCNFVYVPFILTLRDANGTALYHWENKDTKNSTSFARNCRWTAGEGTYGDAFLCWYSGNRKSETGVGGWATNKQIIGYYRGKNLPLLFDKMGDGEFIDMPPVAGYLDLQIGVGVQCYDYDTETSWKLRDDINGLVRWILYKYPSLSIVTKTAKDITKQDVVHTAWINSEAKEELKIDTIFGTLKTPSPAALAQFYYNGIVKYDFFRAGITDQLERLLIGSIYSNYANRHNTLSGTASLLSSFGTYTDDNSPGNYIVKSETQRLIDDESDITIVQFDSDNYQGVEWNENV